MPDIFEEFFGGGVTDPMIVVFCTECNFTKSSTRTKAEKAAEKHMHDKPGHIVVEKR